MANALILDFTDLDKEQATWNVQCELEYLIADFDHRSDGGRQGSTLDRYMDELGSQREISFSRKYYLGSFVEHSETLL